MSRLSDGQVIHAERDDRDAREPGERPRRIELHHKEVKLTVYRRLLLMATRSRVAYLALALLTVVLAACNQHSGGGGGPGY